MIHEPSATTIQLRVEDQCTYFQRQRGIAVTESAQIMIATVLTAFIADPHPSWEIQSQDIQMKYLEQYIHDIPRFLVQISDRLEGREVITAFDVLGWISQNLGDICVYICPFSRP